ncbi:MAG: hypothetical protein U1G08_14170 [Verrucomicrobiota bacterium]
MKANLQSPFSRLLRWATGLIGILPLAVAAQTASVVANHDSYAIGEDISIAFSGGPGRPLDWIGIYPADAVPGAQGTTSTLWFYVDGTRAGSTGLTEGVIPFPGGLSFAGTWKAYLLLNDGYTIAAETTFQVVEAGTPTVHVAKRLYTTDEDITVTFASGPGNALDWIGLYKENEVPGTSGISSTRYLYVDGTQNGAVALTDGSVKFSGGLTTPGRYVAFFLRNDGYDVLASEAFTIGAPSSNLPRLLSIRPADGATGVEPRIRFNATITNGTSSVLLSSIGLKLDGASVQPVVTSANGLVTVSYTNAGISLPLSAHTYELSFTDDASKPTAISAKGSFTTVQYENIVLPAPLYFENFDSTPEGQVPAGWTLTSHTEVQNPDLDLGNLDSASFANWVVLDVNRFTGSFVTYSNPENPADWGTDYQRVLTPNRNNVLNGAEVDGPLASGRMLFGDSGYRNGRSQVLSITTPDYNLTGKDSVYVVFKSLYEQNQDSIGALEYSVDGGANWLPVAYLINAGDIIRTEAGDVDAEATLTTSANDIAVYSDDAGNDVGGTYGAFIGAPINASLAPFIQGRVDDNSKESKRIEKYRLPKADGAKTVRLRFTYAGTDSWYWGVDDFGLYSIAPEAPAISAAVTSEGLRLTWTGDTTGLTLKGSGSLAQPDWQTVPGVSGNSVVVPTSGQTRYFRLMP